MTGPSKCETELLVSSTGFSSKTIFDFPIVEHQNLDMMNAIEIVWHVQSGRNPQISELRRY